jgi:DNA polymerase III subunit delta
MVAVKSGDADRFINRPPPDVFLYLVFGNDAGLIAERSRTILSRAVDDPGDAFQLVRIAGDDLASDPLRLADEANAVPMFGGRKAIGVDSTARALAPAIEPLLKAPPSGCTIVFEAGALKRDHPLRKLFEQEPVAAAIECYPDGPREVARLIDSELASRELTIAPDAKELLLTFLGQDRLTTRSELDKLATYAHGEGRIEVAHVEAIVADASAMVLDKAIDGAFDGNFEAVETTTERLFQSGADVNMLLGSALRHATALHRARIARDGGASNDAGFYGPRRAVAEQQLRLWDASRLAKVVIMVGEAVGHARREPRLAPALAVRALWEVASVARASRGR